MRLLLEFLDQEGARQPQFQSQVRAETGLPISARELIEMRVREEWARGFVQHDQIRARIYQRGQPFLDLCSAIADAIEGFRRRRYLLLVNGRQLSTLEDVIHPTPEMIVKFLYIIPLKGG
jgi:hypothetical protein